MSPQHCAYSSLASDINESIRDLHTRLNRIVISLLSLALPPDASTATSYANGMRPFLRIFEHLEAKSSSSIGNSKGRELENAIQHLFLAQLKRSTRLRNDLQLILRTQDEEHVSNQLPADTTGNTDIDLGASKYLNLIITRIDTAVNQSPHLLLAYTHVLYLAIFSGGRYIRFKLREASRLTPEFFAPFPSQSPQSPPARVQATISAAVAATAGQADNFLNFWTFDPDTHDGEDVKAEFKKRFQVVEEMLSRSQREAVVSEAHWIMSNLMEMVEEIATIQQSHRVGVGGVEKSLESILNQQALLHVNMEAPAQTISPPDVRLFKLCKLIAKHILPLGLSELITAAATGAWRVYSSTRERAKTDKVG